MEGLYCNGYLEIITGPMFAGKSTELIRISKRYQVLGKSILSINHAFDKRYGKSDITTHNNVHLPTQLSLQNLKQIDYKTIENADVILIDEIQFFSDAFEMIQIWVDKYHKIVIIAGLLADSSRKPFGDILRLLPIADKITKLSALCMKCADGTPAHFSKRLIRSSQTTLVGSTDKYEAVCRKHYFK